MLDDLTFSSVGYCECRNQALVCLELNAVRGPLKPKAGQNIALRALPTAGKLVFLLSVCLTPIDLIFFPKFLPLINKVIHAMTGESTFACDLLTCVSP